MKVFYNRARWVVLCPSLDCLAAEQVATDMARAICRCRGLGLCTHSDPCGTVIDLEWPSDPTAIEAICARRPVLNRNWEPHETLDDLKRENLMHGVGI